MHYLCFMYHNVTIRKKTFKHSAVFFLFYQMKQCADYPLCTLYRMMPLMFKCFVKRTV